MKKAYIFPGQGSQFVGMGKDLYENNAECRDLFEHANEIVGFRISDLMFDGTPEDLKQTRVTQPAVFLHSVILAASMGDEFQPDMVGGHSLGEFSALVAAGALSFESGLRLVYARAMAMQKCCEAHPGAMAAVLRLEDEKIEEVCAEVSKQGKGVVIPANMWGKVKTTIQMVASIVIMLMLSIVFDFGVSVLEAPLVIVANVLLWLMAAATLVSGIVYIIQGTKVIDFSK